MRYTDIYYKDLEIVRNSIPEVEELYHKTFFITGASGLIGSAIVDFLIYLNENYDAGLSMVLGSRNPDTLDKRFGKYMKAPWIESYLYDSKKAINLNKAADYVIHAASPANPKWFAEKPAETLMSAFMGIYHVLEYARIRNAGRVMFISSSEVYGKKENNHPYHNKEYGYLDILNPRACYPSAKRAGETLCASYHQEYGVETVIVRPGHVYGPSVTEADTRVSSQFLRDAARGLDLVMKSPGQQLRSYCYSCDCVSALLTVLLHGNPDEGYNISNPDSICTIREIAECIAECAGVNVYFDIPSELEKKGYNLMDNSSVDAVQLLGLGWSGSFDLRTGVSHSVSILREKLQEERE